MNTNRIIFNIDLSSPIAMHYSIVKDILNAAMALDDEAVDEYADAMVSLLDGLVTDSVDILTELLSSREINTTVGQFMSDVFYTVHYDDIAMAVQANMEALLESDNTLSSEVTPLLTASAIVYTCSVLQAIYKTLQSVVHDSALDTNVLAIDVAEHSTHEYIVEIILDDVVAQEEYEDDR